MVSFNDLDKIDAFKKLLALKKASSTFEFRHALTAERVKAYRVPMAGALTYSYAAKTVNEESLSLLQKLADEQQVIQKYKMILDGEVMNTGEKRLVLHHLLRACGAPLGKPVVYEGNDIGAFYAGELERFGAFTDKVHAEKKFDAVVQIGIGGSDLGPRALYLALENWAVKNGSLRMKASFISNVDPDDGAQVLSSLNLSRTLFVLVSKSGTTQETLANELFVKAKLKSAGLDPSKHLVAVTSETSPLAHNSAYLDSFYIDDFIGGRYSSSSAVGGVILSLAYGKKVFLDFLRGAHESDAAALNADIKKNASLMDALIGVYERNVLGYTYTAVLPYSQALCRFPAHLQQLDMESNGKHVNRRGEKLLYSTGPVIFGEPGTNGQHSFFQLLHQGTDVVPLQFVGFSESQRKDDVEVEGSSSQTKLKANLAAQIVAFAKGKEDADPNKNFLGGRPSSLIYGKELTPEVLGALLAHFENKVMFQGFLWNVNSFDQEGVQLGKVLAKKVLSGKSGDAALDAYSELLEI
ncbi:MAG: glucose-6-phosphate isomerase [Treponemataceae bacterium]